MTLLRIAIALWMVVTFGAGNVSRTPTEPALEPAATAMRADTTRLVVARDGNEARYLVREQLMNFDFPSDAIGKTSAVTGTLVLDGQGKVVPGESRFVIDVATLKSDKERRDGYVKRRTLLTDQYPQVTLVPMELRGLPFPLPTSGQFEFDLVGDLTVKDSTRATTWHVAANAADDGFDGIATTHFSFDDFGIDRPRVSIVLSVEDDIRLEYQFRLVRGQ
jgi:polyisoprenoid-binding protein YceI